MNVLILRFADRLLCVISPYSPWIFNIYPNRYSLTQLSVSLFRKILFRESYSENSTQAKHKSGKRLFWISWLSSLPTHWMLSRVMDWWTGIHFSFLVPFFTQRAKNTSIKFSKFSKLHREKKLNFWIEKLQFLTKTLNLEKHRNGNSVMWAKQIPSQNERKMF